MCTRRHVAPGHFPARAGVGYTHANPVDDRRIVEGPGRSKGFVGQVSQNVFGVDLQQPRLGESLTLHILLVVEEPHELKEWGVVVRLVGREHPIGGVGSSVFVHDFWALGSG